jgi:adenylate cyclase
MPEDATRSADAAAEADVDPVEALRALGVPEAAAEEAVASDRIALALVQQLLAEDRSYSFEDVVERTGVDPAVLRERYRALGQAESRRYGEAEIAEATILAELLQVIPPASLIRVLRIDGQAMTRIALAHMDVVYADVVEPIRAAGGDDIAVALALHEAYQTLTPVAGDLLRHSYRRIVGQLLETELVAQATRSGADEVTLAVGFADVVGYTSLSARIDPSGLEEVIEVFETRCYTVAGTLADVQLVKFLGDAAMFVALTPAALATALLALVSRPDDASPLATAPVRAGMAHGPVLLRGGDYYGATVNLAARLTDRARASRVLAAGDLADELAEFELRRTPAMHLRGLGRHKPLSVHLPPAAPRS